MKKLIVLLTAISFLFVGCIDYSSTVKLKSDGSGTIEETVLMSGMILEMMNSFSESLNDSSAENEEFNFFDEEQLKEQAINMGEGVKYLSGEKVELNGKSGYKAIFSFNDISKVRLSENPDEKMPMDQMDNGDESKDEEEFITFHFTKGSPAKLEVILPENKEEDTSSEETDVPTSGENSDDEQAMTEQAKMFLKDFKILMQLEIDGDIEETNATYIEGNTITFLQMDFEKLMELPGKFEEFQKKEPETMSEVKELIKNIPEFKVELNKKVLVKFNKP